VSKPRPACFWQASRGHICKLRTYNKNYTLKCCCSKPLTAIFTRATREAARNNGCDHLSATPKKVCTPDILHRHGLHIHKIWMFILHIMYLLHAKIRSSNLRCRNEGPDSCISYTNKMRCCWRAWESVNICADIPIRRVFFLCQQVLNSVLNQLHLQLLTCWAGWFQPIHSFKPRASNACPSALRYAPAALEALHMFLIELFQDIAFTVF
jgi:hypothetical protein